MPCHETLHCHFAACAVLLWKRPGPTRVSIIEIFYFQVLPHLINWDISSNFTLYHLQSLGISIGIGIEFCPSLGIEIGIEIVQTFFWYRYRNRY